jgi:hypothetical protein
MTFLFSEDSADALFFLAFPFLVRELGLCGLLSSEPPFFASELPLDQ